MMRALLSLSLFAALGASGCGWFSSDSAPTSETTQHSDDEQSPYGQWQHVRDGFAPVPHDRKDELKRQDYGYSLDGEPVLIRATSKDAIASLRAVKGAVGILANARSLNDPEIRAAIVEVGMTHPTSLQLVGVSEADLRWVKGLEKLEVLVVARPTVGEQAIADLGQLPALHTLALPQTTPATVSGLSRFPGLRNLWVSGCDDAVAKALTTLPQLKLLQLSGGSMTKAGFSALGTLEQLEVIRFVKAEVPEGGIAELGNPKLRGVAFEQPSRFSNARASELVGIAGLESLELTSTSVTALPNVSAWPRLRRLDLNASPISDAGLTGLDSLGALEMFGGSHTELTGAMLASLGSRPSLRHLELAGLDALDDVAMSSLSTCCTSVTHLDLAGSKAGPKAFAALASLTQLQVLDATDATIADADAKYLAGLHELRRVQLRGTTVSDKTAKLLQALPKLRSVTLTDTLVTNVDGFASTVQVDWSP